MSKLDELASAAQAPSSFPRRRVGFRRAKPDFALCLVSFLFPLVGLILGLVFSGRPDAKDRANSSACVTWALVGFLFGLVMAVLWFLFLSSIWVNAVLPTQQFEDYSSHALGSSQSSGNSDAGTKLVLESWNWKTRRGFAIAEGEVTNISGSKLQNVMAVVSYYDASGEVITTDSTLTEFNPILPGQTSPFRVMTVRNPAMESTRLRFRHLMGGTISHRPCR